jgi:2-succinyl-5-enolpyruvyl-6-hydroxy-3-cyclohexene-1-carboxylate synthase
MEGFPLAWSAFGALVEVGVTECVVCAGARNSTLVVVAAGLAERGVLRVWSHFEERAAAFFALGRARATGRPVAVITTSGTAVAELLPAMIEAHYSGLPLVAVTADRPLHYRGSGAPQAIEQVNIFGPYAHGHWDGDAGVPSLRDWSRRGPFHLNLCLGEGAEFPQLRELARGGELPPRAETVGTLFDGSAIESVDGLLMVGDVLPMDMAATAAVAHRWRGPIYAEATSGLRALPALRDRLIHCADATLARLGGRQIVRLGGVPTCRFWRDLEGQPEVSVASFHRTGLRGLARENRPSLYDAGQDFEEAMGRDRRLSEVLQGLLRDLPTAEPALLAGLASMIPSESLVMVGNSLAVREWNLAAPFERGHRVHALRGANGIDGNLSAFVGLAVDEPEAWCVSGDLTALYDLAAPWMLAQLPPGRRRFVVLHNGGGRIFRRLPSLRGMTEREQALMENPHETSLESWARMWKMDYLRGGAELLRDPRELASAGDHAVIELHPDGDATEAFWESWQAAQR